MTFMLFLIKILAFTSFYDRIMSFGWHISAKDTIYYLIVIIFANVAGFGAFAFTADRMAMHFTREQKIVHTVGMTLLFLFIVLTDFGSYCFQ